MKLIIDSREKKKSFFLECFTNLGYDVEIKTLNIGDFYLVDKGIIIERKDMQDFSSSVRNKKLQKQLAQMKQYPHPFLIIEGDNDFENPFNIGWTVKHHYGAKASLWRLFHIPIFSVSNKEEFVILCDRLFTKIDDGKIFDISQTELLKESLGIEDYRLKLLLQFPKVGPKRAEKLLEKNEDNLIEELDAIIEKFIKTQ